MAAHGTIPIVSVREPSKPSLPDDRRHPIDTGADAVLEKKIDVEAVAALLRGWVSEDERDPEPPDSWEDFKRALDSSRHSTRRLFP
jgi:hypothetical protein